MDGRDDLLVQIDDRGIIGRLAQHAVAFDRNAAFNRLGRLARVFRKRAREFHHPDQGASGDAGSFLVREIGA